jgi:hypothetical protein
MASAGRRSGPGPWRAIRCRCPGCGPQSRPAASITVAGVREFGQRRPLGPGAPGAVIECIIGYRVWLGDNCGLRIRMHASDLPGRVCVLTATSPASAHPTLPSSDGPMERTSWLALLRVRRYERIPLLQMDMDQSDGPDRNPPDDACDNAVTFALTCPALASPGI